ncbi:MAG: hypothetical protein ACYTAN_08715 [Planctomycetota bacterium]
MKLEYRGKRQTATVPDTLDLAERARLAISGIGGSIDTELLTMYGLVHYATPRPHQVEWASAQNGLDPKFGESLPLLRIMSGESKRLDLEERYFDAILSRVDDGLYWDRADPRRPWRNSYAGEFYGEGRDEDFAQLWGGARLMRALDIWNQLGGVDDFKHIMRELVSGMSRVSIKRGDYSYYPEKGGWSEPCAYPRSGWLNTDEAEGDTEGGEGSIICFHGHEIYGAAQWYARSGDEEALDLAARLSKYVLKSKFWGGLPDPNGDRTGLCGHVAPVRPDPPYVAGAQNGHWTSHFHARAIALRGLLEYARVAGDIQILEFVRRSYEFTMTQGIPRMGWINCCPAALDVCEGCALGDIVALGIRLSDAGLGDYWDDVDAVVRNQLVEQQLIDGALLERTSANSSKESWSERGDTWPGQIDYDNTIERTLGVFAGMSRPNAIAEPWSMHCCTANASQGLYYAWEGALREDDENATVNLLLNRVGKLVDIASHLPYEGKVTIHNKAARSIRVRIPYWVDRKSLKAEVEGQVRRHDRVGNYLLFDEIKPGDSLVLTFPMSESTASYTIAANSPGEQVFTCTFRGSTLVDIDPKDDDPTNYPLYRREHMRKDTAPMKEAGLFVPEAIVRNW